MKHKLKGILLISGSLLLSAALALTCFNVADAHRAGAAAERAQCSLAEHIAVVSQTSFEDDETPLLPETEPATVTVENVNYMGVLELPGLGLSLPVAASWDYDSLQDTPCRYSGSPHDDNLVICAHNYYSHFGRIGELSPGDEAVFTDCRGNRIVYTLAEGETLEPGDVGRMTDSGYALTLFTCTWSGAERRTLRFDRTAVV